MKLILITCIAYVVLAIHDIKEASAWTIWNNEQEMCGSYRNETFDGCYGRLQAYRYKKTFFDGIGSSV